MIEDAGERYLRSMFGEATGFVVGLDVGMARDYSAVIIDEKRMALGLDEPFHAIRFAHRFRLGTKYSDVARGIAGLIARLPERPDPVALYVDSTGVGRPVFDLLRDEA